MKILSPDTLFKRIKYRNRLGEENIDLDKICQNNTLFRSCYDKFINNSISSIKVYSKTA